MTGNETRKSLFFGGIILTMNDEQPVVEAVGIENEKIISAGELNEVKKLLDSGYDMVDLNGNTMLPGFIDCHMHPILSVYSKITVNLKGVNSLSELQTLLKNEVLNRNSDDFIVGLDLMEDEFEVPVFPTRDDLDTISDTNPIFLLRHDGHIGVANSKALELGGITDSSVSPEGGEIQKDKNGRVTGILKEHATSLIISNIPLPESKIIFEGASNFYNELTKKGITSIHGSIELDREGGVENNGGVAIPLLITIKDMIPQNLYGMIFTKKPKKLKRIKKTPLHEDDPEGRFKIGCLKAWFDGSFGASTAYLFEPYKDQEENCGGLVITEKELYERMKEAHNLGYQIAVHSIGDKSNRILMDLYIKLFNEYPRENHRHRIEHASMLTPDVIRDMKKYGIIASCQPPFLNSEYNWLENRVGKGRIKEIYPFKSIIDAGICLVSGSDCPIEDPDPVKGLYALVTRNGFVPEECITIEQALKTYTINGAYASFEENIKGTIESGKFADLIILDANPLEVSINKIRDIKVLQTIIRGKTVFKND